MQGASVSYGSFREKGAADGPSATAPTAHEVGRSKLLLHKRMSVRFT
jgi:hypothetical protein